MNNDSSAKEQGCVRAHRPDAQLAALNSLQDWSKWLVGVDAGVLGLLAFAFEKGLASVPEVRVWLAGAIVSFCASLVIATWLVGAVPAFVQRLEANDQNEKEPCWLKWRKNNIYEFTYGGIPVQAYAFLQHITFMTGAVLLTRALWIGLWPK
jgi:hypothetical protein